MVNSEGRIIGAVGVREASKVPTVRSVVSFQFADLFAETLNREDRHGVVFWPKRLV